MLTLSLTAVLARRLGARRVQTVGVLIVTSGAILPILSPRPALAAQALFLLSIVFALAWADRAARHGSLLNGAVALAAGLLFSWTGNWIHLSWSTLAAAAGLAWTVIWALTGGPRVLTRVVMIVAGLVGLAVGVLLGPYGTDVFERSSVVLTACRDLIYEWSSPFDSEMGLRWWPLAFAVAAVVVLALWWCVAAWRRRRDDPRLPLAAALALGSVPYALGGFLFIRFIPVAMLTLAPLAAAAFTALVDRLHGRVADPPPDARYAAPTAAGVDERRLLAGHPLGRPGDPRPVRAVRRVASRRARDRRGQRRTAPATAACSAAPWRPPPSS